MKIRHIAMILVALSLTACQNLQSQPGKRAEGPDIATLTAIDPCDTGSLNVRCVDVKLSQTSGTWTIDDIPDLHFVGPNHNIFFRLATQGFFFAAGDQAIVFPSSAPSGFNPPPPNEFSCRAILARKWAVCINRHANTGKFKYVINVVDSSGNPVSKDPAMVND